MGVDFTNPGFVESPAWDDVDRWIAAHGGRGKLFFPEEAERRRIQWMYDAADLLYEVADSEGELSKDFKDECYEHASDLADRLPEGA